MKRPDADEYYWYKPTRESDWKEWQPVLVKEGKVWAIGLADPTPLDDLDGVFVKMGRPIPMLGSVQDLKKIPVAAEPRIEGVHRIDEIEDHSESPIRDEWDRPGTFREVGPPPRIKDEWED